MMKSTLRTTRCPHCGGDVMTAETNIYNAESIHRCFCGGQIVDGRCRRCGALMIDMSHFHGHGDEPTMIKLSVGGTNFEMFGIMRRIEVEREVAPMLYAGNQPLMSRSFDDSVRIHMLMSSVYMRE